MRWLDNLQRHVELAREARKLGISVEFGMTSTELRQAIERRRLEVCELQYQSLKKRGFVIGATLEIGDRIVRIQKIVVEKRPEPKVTVHYWIISPWTNKNNQGRANHRSAAEVLKKGKLVR